LWEKECMIEPLRRSDNPAPKIISIDEIAVRKGHTYLIVVSDLECDPPIWFGGIDRSEESPERIDNSSKGDDTTNLLNGIGMTSLLSANLRTEYHSGSLKVSIIKFE
jgi:hypothetical protein